jgi:ligand-binding sensor domain-containing protein
MGTYAHGLIKFDDINWTTYKTSNSGIPNNWVNAVAIDVNNNKWLATLGGGIAKFDGTIWTVYNSTNSGLPDNWLNTITIDAHGNKWIATNKGLAVFKEGGVVTSVKEIQENEIPTTASLSQNYPNPLNSTTTIKYKVTEPEFVSLKVFNSMGSEVASLVNEQKPSGDYSIEWNATGFKSGIYFCKLQTGKLSEAKKMLLLK